MTTRPRCYCGHTGSMHSINFQPAACQVKRCSCAVFNPIPKLMLHDEHERSATYVEAERIADELLAGRQHNEDARPRRRPHFRRSKRPTL